MRRSSSTRCAGKKLSTRAKAHQVGRLLATNSLDRVSGLNSQRSLLQLGMETEVCVRSASKNCLKIQTSLLNTHRLDPHNSLAPAAVECSESEEVSRLSRNPNALHL